MMNAPPPAASTASSLETTSATGSPETRPIALITDPDTQVGRAPQGSVTPVGKVQCAAWVDIARCAGRVESGLLAAISSVPTVFYDRAMTPMGVSG